MSAEFERLFSAAGRMVSALRTDLDAETIEICQVVRSWYRAGIIKDLDPLLHSHVETQLDGVYETLSDNELILAQSKWLQDGEDSASEGGDIVQQQPEDELRQNAKVRPNRRESVESLKKCTCTYMCTSTPLNLEIMDIHQLEA